MLSDEFIVGEMLKWIFSTHRPPPRGPLGSTLSGKHCVLTPSRRTDGTDFCMFRSKRSRPSQLHGRLTPSETRARCAKDHQPSWNHNTHAHSAWAVAAVASREKARSSKALESSRPTGSARIDFTNASNEE